MVDKGRWNSSPISQVSVSLFSDGMVSFASHAARCVVGRMSRLCFFLFALGDQVSLGPLPHPLVPAIQARACVHFG